MDNNLFYYPSGGDYKVRLGHRGDDVLLADWKEMGYDQNSIIADPKFVGQNPTARAGNSYRLQSDSPAFALGFEQIDTSKIGLCGQPWNNKTNCPGDNLPQNPTNTPAPQCPNRSLGNLNCDSASLIDELDLAQLLSDWTENSLTKLNNLLSNWKTK